MSVLVVTANPSLDRILRVQKVTPGTIHRSPSATVSAGGKGINVSRALHCISNKRVINSGILGGHPGKYLEYLAEQEGLHSNWYWLRGSNNVTRSCVLVSDAHHDSTVFNEEGPTIDADDWNGFVQHISSMSNEFEIIIFSGSLPVGVDPVSFASVVHGTSHIKH
jgi:tagatose 6-phosphate kinase